MLAVVLGVGGFHVAYLMTSQLSFDFQYLVSDVMTSQVANVFP
jgi:hypothetical protein